MNLNFDEVYFEPSALNYSLGKELRQKFARWM